MEKEIKEFEEMLKKSDFEQRLKEIKEKYQDKKMIIYGAGFLARAVFNNYNLSDLNIIAVADRNFPPATTSFYGYKACSVYDIPAISPEILFIFVKNSVAVETFLRKNLEEYLSEPITLISVFE
jgi:hypothetical protein